MPQSTLYTVVGAAQATVLFADVVGSTALYERLGDAAAKAMVDELFVALRAVIQAARGVVVKTIGDELMCAFDTPDDAVDAARKMHHAAQARNLGTSEKLDLRIGFQSGPVIRDSGDVFGDTVNTAARIAGEAHRNRIFTTRETANRLGEILARDVTPWGAATVKGKEAPLELVEILLDPGGAYTITSPRDQESPKFTRVVLRFDGKTCVLERGGRALRFGSVEGNDLVVDEAWVSRGHGEVVIRGGRPVLVDSSRNGTYVSFGSEAFFQVKGECVLRASGRMSLGRLATDSLAAVVEFEVE